MVTITGWKADGDKIFLKAVDELIEFPIDIYKELLKQGPPTEEKMIRDLIEKIHAVRVERIMTVENVDKELAEIDEKEKKVMDALESSVEDIEVKKYSAILRSLAGRRASCSQRRHLVKLLHQEEGALSKELLTKL